MPRRPRRSSPSPSRGLDTATPGRVDRTIADTPKYFRVLSIDGGGIRGILPARILTEFETALQQPISSCFDLIVGTSTGGILALGLAAAGDDGKPAHAASELEAIYGERGPEIFSSRGVWNLVERVEALRQGSAPYAASARYFPEALEALLRGYFDDLRLDQVLVDVAVTAFDLLTGEPMIFRSSSAAADAGPGGEVPLIRDLARATSAAPTFFPPLELDVYGGTHLLADGGLFANNPAQIGLIDALRVVGQSDRVTLVSLGTGVPVRSTDESGHGPLSENWLQLGNAVFTAIMDGTSEAQDQLLGELLDAEPGTPRYWRLQPELVGCNKAMDDVSPANIAALSSVADGFVEKNAPMLKAIASALTSAG